MEALLGTSIGVYLGVVVILMGFCAYMTGQAIATTWKPVGQLIFFLILQGLAARFLVFALYEGDLFSLSGWLIDTATLLAIGLFAFYISRSRKMVAQYPWRYERVGLFGWRRRQE